MQTSNQFTKAGIFRTPYTQNSGYNGKPFSFVDEITADNCSQYDFDYNECGQAFVIRFECGIIIVAWPEEVIFDKE